MVAVLTSIRGRKMGLASDGRLVVGPDGTAQTLFGPAPTVTVSSAELLALNATPKTIVAAPGAGLAIIPKMAMLYKPAGTAYADIAAGDDMVFKYTNGSGAQCSSVIEATGFLDQTTAETRWVGAPGATTTTAGSYEPVANAAVVLHMLTGEITTGDTALYVRIWYDIVETVFTS